MESDWLDWKFMRFYGHPEVDRRKEAWALLHCLSDFNPLPWLSACDFNEIIYFSKKMGSHEAQLSEGGF